MRSDATPERVKTVLWVDDEPCGNAREIAKLEEDGKYVADAGLELTRAVRE